METLHLSTKKIDYKYFAPLFRGPIKVRLSNNCLENIKNSHNNLCDLLKKDKTIYGVNTGFGNLSHILISSKDQWRLQNNLIRSHASGIGDPLDLGTVRTILLLKLLTYAHGYSGVRPILVEKIMQFLNKDILPVIPRKGSVGASGDLSPLGHMALCLIGEGEVFFKGKRKPTKTVLKKARIKPIKLESKEGISLINGTQVSTALSIKACLKGEVLLKTADIVGALSVENSFSSRKVFRAKIHKLKEHPGQRISAKNVYKLLMGSNIVKSHSRCGKIQDPYSFRCIPHVHGACRDSFTNAASIINNEINSVSDNPLIMDQNTVMNSGHFHGEHIAQAMDILSIAFSEIGAISERRTHYFMKGIGPGIPPFVTKEPGIESGYMIAHVTSTALVSENKTLAHPASVDSLPTSGGQEDLVSMAPWAGYKLLRIQKNISYILAIEMIVAGAANALASGNLKPGKGTQVVLEMLDNHCKYSSGDRSLTYEIDMITELINSSSVLGTVLSVINLD